MASFIFGGIEGLEITLQDLASMTEEEKRAIIEPAAEVYRAKLKEVLDRLGLRDTGQLIESITLTMKSDKDGEIKGVVGASGKRKKAFTGVRRRKNGQKAGHYSGTNTELLYILENGTPRMRAYHPTEVAEKESEEEVFAAFEKGWDEYLKSKNL